MVHEAVARQPPFHRHHRAYELTGDEALRLRDLGVSADGIAFIRRNLLDGPSRAISQNKVSVTVRLPNPSTGYMLEAESDGEFGYAEIALASHTTRCLLGQPAPIKHVYALRGGRSQTVLKRADFIHVDDDFVALVECKRESELKALQERFPNNWGQDENLRWYCRSGEEAAAHFGMQFIVAPAGAINQIALTNYRILDEYFDARCPDLSPTETARLDGVFKSSSALTLEGLVTALDQDADLALRAIAKGDLYFDRLTDRLDLQSECPIFRSELALRAYQAMRTAKLPAAANLEVACLAPGATLVWHDQVFRVIGDSASQLLLQSDADGRVVQVPIEEVGRYIGQGLFTVTSTRPDEKTPHDLALARLSGLPEIAIQRALKRHDAVVAHIDGRRSSCAPRSVARWLANYRRAESMWGIGLLGLVDKPSGNYLPRHSQSTRSLFQAAMQRHWLNTKERSFTLLYGALQDACDDAGSQVPSAKTVRKWLHQEKTVEDTTRARSGDAVAYKHAPFYFHLHYHTPVHGLFPWHIVHIDHTKIDVQIVAGTNKLETRRAWLSIAVDATSRRVLAVILLWDPPSHRTCALLIRAMVKKWGRVPNTIVVDGGSEFRSTHFEMLLAALNIKRKTRPGKKPRFGALIERMFGLTDQALIHQLSGNTKATKRDVRTVTTETNPKNAAIWTLPALLESLEDWFFNVYDGLEHGTLGMPPSQAYAEAQARFGTRQHKFVKFSRALEISTMSGPPKGTARVVPGRGVKILQEFYWSDVLRSGKLERSRIPVKYDPYNIARAWAFVDGEWVDLVCRHTSSVAGLSVKAAETYTDKQRQLAARQKQRFSLRSTAIARMANRNDATEAALRQLALDRDQNAIAKHVFGPESISGQNPDFRPATARARVETVASAPPERIPVDRCSKIVIRSLQEF